MHGEVCSSHFIKRLAVLFVADTADFQCLAQSRPFYFIVIRDRNMYSGWTFQNDMTRVPAALEAEFLLEDFAGLLPARQRQVAERHAD